MKFQAFACIIFPPRFNHPYSFETIGNSEFSNSILPAWFTLIETSIKIIKDSAFDNSTFPLNFEIPISVTQIGTSRDPVFFNAIISNGAKWFDKTNA